MIRKCLNRSAPTAFLWRPLSLFPPWFIPFPLPLCNVHYPSFHPGLFHSHCLCVTSVIAPSTLVYSIPTCLCVTSVIPPSTLVYSIPTCLCVTSVILLPPWFIPFPFPLPLCNVRPLSLHSHSVHYPSFHPGLFHSHCLCVTSVIAPSTLFYSIPTCLCVTSIIPPSTLVYSIPIAFV